MGRVLLGLCCVICGAYVSADAWIGWQRTQQAAPPVVPRPIVPGWTEV